MRLYSDTYYDYPPIEVFSDGTINLVTVDYDLSSSEQPLKIGTSIHQLNEIVKVYSSIISDNRVIDRSLPNIEIWIDGDISFTIDSFCPLAGEYKIHYTTDIHQIHSLIKFFNSCNFILR